MVRRGRRFESVRGLSQEARKRGAFDFPASLHFVQRAQVWNRFWNNQAKDGGILLSRQASQPSVPRPSPRSGRAQKVDSVVKLGQTESCAFDSPRLEE